MQLSEELQHHLPLLSCCDYIITNVSWKNQFSAGGPLELNVDYIVVQKEEATEG